MTLEYWGGGGGGGGGSVSPIQISSLDCPKAEKNAGTVGIKPKV